MGQQAETEEGTDTDVVEGGHDECPDNGQREHEDDNISANVEAAVPKIQFLVNRTVDLDNGVPVRFDRRLGIQNDNIGRYGVSGVEHDHDSADDSESLLEGDVRKRVGSGVQEVASQARLRSALAPSLSLGRRRYTDLALVLCLLFILTERMAMMLPCGEMRSWGVAEPPPLRRTLPATPFVIPIVRSILQSYSTLVLYLRGT